MLSTERQAFEDQLAVLFGAFPTFLTPPRTEAYWRGLQKMPMPTFVRCIDSVLGEKGEEKLPTVNRIWEISRSIRAQANQPVDTQPKATADNLHIVQAYGNRALVNYLMRKRGASHASLQLLLREKKRLCDAYELITSEEPEASLELRDKLFEAWDKVFETMPADELKLHQEHFARTGRALDQTQTAVQNSIC